MVSLAQGYEQRQYRDMPFAQEKGEIYLWHDMRRAVYIPCYPLSRCLAE